MSVMNREGLLSGEFAWQSHANVYPKAVNIMRKLKDQYDNVLSSVDVIVMSTTLSPASRFQLQMQSRRSNSKRREE
jgi:amidase